MTDTLPLTWGNPGVKTFKKEHIRQVAASGTTSQVNAKILDIVAGLFNHAQRHGVELPKQITGWVAPKSGGPFSPAHHGIAIENIPGLAAIAGTYGFEAQGPLLVFTGDIDAARAVADQAATEDMLAMVAGETRVERPADSWGTDRPGIRELTTGARGDDVQFFQMVYNAPNQGGTWDEWCTGLAAHMQQRWGIAVTGTTTPDLWRGILPNTLNYSISYGEDGHIVRVLQAAISAYDWDPYVRVNGRFDQDTLAAVQEIQKSYGLRVNPAVGPAEWAILLGRKPGE